MFDVIHFIVLFLLTSHVTCMRSAVGHILVKLDDTKRHLKALNDSGKADPLEVTAKQIEVATLIEKLARAAVSMKRME